MIPRTEEEPEEFGEGLYQNVQTDDDGKVLVRLSLFGATYAPAGEASGKRFPDQKEYARRRRFPW